MQREKKVVLSHEVMDVVKKLIALVFVALLAGLAGGYIFKSEISLLKPSETWHFVMSFTTNETQRTSPSFYLSGTKWRIKWNLIAIEEPAPEEFPYYYALNKTLWRITFGGWNGFLVYDESRYVISTLDIALYQFDTLYRRNATIAGGGEINWYYENDPNIKGICYLVYGEGKLYIEVRGLDTPIALTIESYY